MAALSLSAPRPVWGQARPVTPVTPVAPVNPGNGGNNGGNFIGVLPVLPNNNNNNAAAVTGPRIVTVGGILSGQSAQAAVVVPNATAGSGGGTTTTYQWTISGGRITSDPTRQTVTFTADAAGSVSLNVVVTTAGSGVSTSTEVSVISPALAGSITVNPTAQSGNNALTASVPSAQNNDRSFRWSVLGAGAAINGQANGSSVTIRPGNPGLLEVICDVTLQQVATVTLRAFVTVTGTGPSVALAVNNGTGGGSYPSGSRVELFALPPAPGMVFDRWVGDTSVLGNAAAAAVAALSARTTATVGTTPATLTATYRAAAAWTPVTVTGFNPISPSSPNGTTLVYYVPPEARGVVFLLHDTGGSAGAWFTGAEQLTLARDLVAAGFGVAALSSVNRTTGSWSTQASLAANPDAATHAAAITRLVRDGTLAANRPVFLLGVATGGDAAGQFADLLADAALPVRGVVAYCALGSASLPILTRLPQFFALSSHDPSLGASATADAQNNAQLLVGRGITANVFSNAAAPVHPNRFRILSLTNPSFTAVDAQAVWNAVKAANLIDANNYARSAPTVDAVKAALPAAYQARAAEVATQMAVAYGAPEFFSDANSRVVTFLNGRANNAGSPSPGRIINLSTRAQVAYVGDSFTVGFNLSGNVRTTLLIRGVGPGLARFGVSGALLAPRLEVRRGNTLLDANEGWDKVSNPNQVAAAANAVAAFPLAPGSLDTALVLQLDPGTYTATIRGLNGASGEALAEIYDVTRNAARLTNLSVLSRIGADGDPLIPGIVIAGNNPRTLLARAVSQSLSDLGLPGNSLLGDPRLLVLNNNQQIIANNNNWTQTSGPTLTAAFPAVGAFPLRSANDAALIDAFAPGSYTLQAGPTPVGGAGGGNANASQTGTVLVEVYEVP